MAARNSGAIERVKAKLQNNIESGRYYEAHQMYRTLHYRYTTQERFRDSVDLLYSGAVLLLKKEQYESGVDLSFLVIESLKNLGVQCTDKDIENVAELHRLIPPECPDRTTFVLKSIQWSSTLHPPCKNGHPLLHQYFAADYWKEKNYHQSRYHYLRSQDGEGCASMLIEYHVTQGYQSEVDLFIAQIVFQFLCLKNEKTACVAFGSYGKNHPQVKSTAPYVLPLLNFLQFLLIAVKSGTITHYAILCEKYKPAIDRDPTNCKYLDRIGQLYFGMPAPKPKTGGGLLGNLLSMFDEDDSDASDDEATYRPAAQSTASEIRQMDLD